MDKRKAADNLEGLYVLTSKYADVMKKFNIENYQRLLSFFSELQKNTGIYTILKDDFKWLMSQKKFSTAFNLNKLYDELLLVSEYVKFDESIKFLPEEERPVIHPLNWTVEGKTVERHAHKAIHIVANIQHQRIKQERGVAHKQYEQDQSQRQRNVKFR